MIKIKQSILLRVRIAFLFVFLFGGAIVYRIFDLQMVQGPKWQKMAEATSLQFRTIKATRGNIYSDNGSLLATSLPFYRVCMDPTIMKDEVYRQGIDSLALELSRFFGDRSKAEYKQKINDARQAKRKYLILNRLQIGYQDKKRMESWPIFREGRFRGGVIFEKVEKRFKPFSNLANRTIGYINESESGAGLEFSFNDNLRGKHGEALFRRVAGGSWQQVFGDTEKRPEEGYDIVTTLDVNIQDVSESSLLRHLQHHNADRGCVVVMEVATGHIKAMANLSRTSSGYYAESYNLAVGQQGLREPGSTFKLASMIALFEDSNLKLADTIDTGNGQHRFYNNWIRDHKPGGYGKITVQEAFEKSSNIAVARMVDTHFGLKPDKFMDYIRKFGLADPLGFQLKGEGLPNFPPRQKWSGITLPWMAYGYGFEITPLQTLAFYNAVANGGKLMRPMLVSAIRRADRVEQEFAPEVLEQKICSTQTLESVRRMLEGVVERGTATNIKNAHYAIAGKTGTAQTLVEGRYVKKYYTSFAGYFPADRPKYSAIVVIDNPKGYSQYGSDVAAPVFKEIADKIYARDLEMHPPYAAPVAEKKGDFPVVQAGYMPELYEICKLLGVKQRTPIAEDWVKAQVDSASIDWTPRASTVGRVPDVRGMTLRDALYLLENKGLKVQYTGRGRVQQQSQLPGDRAIKGSYINLKLG
ncbi:penicillin-binding protein [Cesiribacter andamanensis]|uniref:Peptidoglycan synthase FtsI n=1 Tax=Cesiribacter andamanensis AMV16 TaxID=1279009 RepID=M7NYT1_9BACT|nr:penicillin-binding protein [Cesiribacter andamanensis]EMR03539.1 Peptidoglycan synthase FtsI precursor [Cesiribacter andamanensis AMV16]